MLLIVATVLLLNQPGSSIREIYGTIRARFPEAKVDTARMGSSWRISIRHREPRPSKSGGQGGQQAVGSATPPPPVEMMNCTDQITLVPKGLTRQSADRLSWEPADPDYRTVQAYLGIGLGYQWYVNTTYHHIVVLRHDFHLTEGENPAKLSVRTLESRDGLNSADASLDLVEMGDDAVKPLEAAARRTPEAISILGRIRTSNAVQALLRLHSDGRLKADVEATFGGGEPTEEARPIYEAGLRDGSIPVAAARAALRFAWKEMLPAIDRAYATTASDYEALELLDLRHRIRSGKSLPSFEKVHEYFQGWTPHDEMAVLQAEDPDYGVLVAFRMLSYATKGGAPYRADGIRLLEALKKAGLTARVEAMVTRFHYEHTIEIERKRASGLSG